MTNVAITWHYKCYVRLLLISNKRAACFSADKRRFDKTNPYCVVALLKVRFFVDLQVKNKCLCQESIIMHGVSVRENVNRRKSNFYLQNCQRLWRECLLTGICKYKVLLGRKKWNWKKCWQVELSAYESFHWRRVDYMCTAFFSGGISYVFCDWTFVYATHYPILSDAKN